MLYCDHNKAPLIVVLLANYALIVSLWLNGRNSVVQVPSAKLFSKLLKNSLQVRPFL